MGILQPPPSPLETDRAPAAWSDSRPDPATGGQVSGATDLPSKGQVGNVHDLTGLRPTGQVDPRRHNSQISPAHQRDSQAHPPNSMRAK